MANDTATIALNGEVHIDDFANAMDCFRRMVVALTKEVAAGKAIAWRLDGLEVSSALATIRGLGDVGAVESVVEAYQRTGQSLQDEAPIPYSDAVQGPARDLANLINGHIHSIRFETNVFDAEITRGKSRGEAPQTFVVRRGSVRGRIQSISSRAGLRFTLYDDLEDRAISCYLQSGSEETMRESWGKYARVEGLVRRNLATGKPSTVRQVTRVVVLPEGAPDEYREAIGCAPAIAGSISPEEAVRKGRDG